MRGSGQPFALISRSRSVSSVSRRVTRTWASMLRDNVLDNNPHNHRLTDDLRRKLQRDVIGASLLFIAAAAAIPYLDVAAAVAWLCHNPAVQNIFAIYLAVSLGL